MEYKFDEKPYLNVVTNKILGSLYQRNAESVGVEMCEDPAILSKTTGSTDMGNVSQEVPAIHPHFYIGTDHVAHSHPFADAAGKKL